MQEINKNEESAEMGLGIILGVIIAIALIAVFFIYALPAINNRQNNNTNTNPASIMLKVPANSSTTTTTTSGY